MKYAYTSIWFIDLLARLRPMLLFAVVQVNTALRVEQNFTKAISNVVHCSRDPYDAWPTREFSFILSARLFENGCLEFLVRTRALISDRVHFWTGVLLDSDRGAKERCSEVQVSAREACRFEIQIYLGASFGLADSRFGYSDERGEWEGSRFRYMGVWTYDLYRFQIRIHRFEIRISAGSSSL